VVAKAEDLGQWIVVDGETVLMRAGYWKVVAGCLGEQEVSGEDMWCVESSAKGGGRKKESATQSRFCAECGSGARRFSELVL
jgi:hypothetical protein